MAEQNSSDKTVPSRASNMEPAEGSRENTNLDSGGITNRPLERERHEQQELPPRGGSKEGRHA